ncbi:MAG: DUF4160 domain-containing protein [Verrucomicrobiota bacterium]|nr:DUF4160 domain-containing protein [Verrucomicrobiota bacterium]
MPVLSRFYGIVVRMLFAPLLGAHFHALYGEDELMVSMDPGAIIQDEAPARVRYMVLEWATRHQNELMEAWDRCRSGLKPQPIAPLP